MRRAATESTLRGMIGDAGGYPPAPQAPAHPDSGRPGLWGLLWGLSVIIGIGR